MTDPSTAPVSRIDAMIANDGNAVHKGLKLLAGEIEAAFGKVAAPAAANDVKQDFSADVQTAVQAVVDKAKADLDALLADAKVAYEHAIGEVEQLITELRKVQPVIAAAAAASQSADNPA